MNIIKSIGDNQHEIIKNILELYVDDLQITLDPTYSKGNFYNKGSIKQPLFKSDLISKFDDVLACNANTIPLENSTQNCIMFDPPFVVGQTKKDGVKGIIRDRFEGFPYIEDLWKWYGECLTEFYRLLKNNGVLIFKCQDTVSSSKQYLSHVWIINRAEQEGFYCKDMFVLTAKHRLVGHNHKNQQHSRKFHCYFLVFIKKDNNISHAPFNYGKKR